jgi:hypothetical protein
MPFGRYKGQPLSEIPESYLLWVWHEAEASKPWLKAAVMAELERRERTGRGADDWGGHAGRTEGHGTGRGPVHPPLAELRGVLTRWYREMAMRFHPDRTLDGGEAMKAINFAHERLQELLEIR